MDDVRTADRLSFWTRPDVLRSVAALTLAVLSFAAGNQLGGLRRSTKGVFHLFGWTGEVPLGWLIVIITGLALVFVITGVAASRALGRLVDRVATARAGIAVGSLLRVICMVIGYLTVLFGVLALLRVNVGSLLVGGALTGVVLGIAAQQTLGNFFAGMVLLFSRPYVPGDRITVYTGAMGGPFAGRIVSAGLIYTVLQCDDRGLIRMPNAGVLAAAIGPAPVPEPATTTQPLPPGATDPGPLSEASPATAAASSPPGRSAV